MGDRTCRLLRSAAVRQGRAGGQWIAIRQKANAEHAAVEQIGLNVTMESLKRFSEIARTKLRTETGEYHRDHFRACAQRIEVVSKSEIRLMGNKHTLLRAHSAASSIGAAAKGVRSSVLKWRAGGDSNSRRRPD